MRIVQSRTALLVAGGVLLVCLLVALASPSVRPQLTLVLIALAAGAATTAMWEVRRMSARQARMDEVLRRVAAGSRRRAKRTGERVARALRDARDRDGANFARFEWLARQLETSESQIADQLEGYAKLVLSVSEQVASLTEQADKITADLRSAQRLLTEIQSGEHSQSLRKRLVADIQALSLVHEARTMPVLSSWAMAPRVLDAVLRAIRSGPVAEPLIVEMGSGASTAWIAQELRTRGGGRVVALEHDRHYAEATRRQLREAQLEEYAEVRYAPLAPITVDGESFNWYTEYQDLPDIDVLVVDGPPSATGREARYPAVPVLIDKLKPGAFVILDDAIRVDEASIVERWTTAGAGRRLRLVEEVDRAAVMQVPGQEGAR